MASKRKYITKNEFNTGEFTPRWPSISEESQYQGKPTGRYEVKETIDEGSDIHLKYKAQYEAADKEARKVFGKSYKGQYTPFKPHKVKNPETEEYDEVPGKIDVVFKAPAKYTKDGVEYDKALPVVDKYGRPITKPVWGGSRVEVSYYPDAYAVSATVSGVKFRMMAVKVNSLVTAGSNPNEGLGGFVFESAPADAPTDEQEEDNTNEATSGEPTDDLDF